MRSPQACRARALGEQRRAFVSDSRLGFSVRFLQQKRAFIFPIVASRRNQMADKTSLPNAKKSRWKNLSAYAVSSY